MGKLEQLAEGRMQGMAFALKVCKDAENKLSRIDGDCRIVTYKLQEGV